MLSTSVLLKAGEVLFYHRADLQLTDFLKERFLLASNSSKDNWYLKYFNRTRKKKASFILGRRKKKQEK